MLRSPEGFVVLSPYHLGLLAITAGIEPATSCVTGMRSNRLNYATISRLLILTSSCLNKLGSFNEVNSSIGWNGGTRTHDLTVNSRLLYRLSYEPICTF